MSRRGHSSLAVILLAAAAPVLIQGCGGDALDDPTRSSSAATAGAPGLAAEPPPGEIVPSAPSFGWTGGTFSVGDGGAAEYTLPLWVPEGRGVVEPKLALSYNSRGGNGLLGVGWSLDGLPSITWCPRTYAQDGYTERLHHDGSDGLCLGDNRLMPITAPQFPTVEFRTEREMFARIVAFGMEDNVPDYFEVRTRDGLISTFGGTDDSRLRAYLLQAGPDLAEPSLVRAPGDRLTIAWSLSRVQDHNGNQATVEYLRSEGNDSNRWWVQMRPSVIRYAPDRRVVFGYQARPDPIDQYRWGVHVRDGFRMTSVAMFDGPEGPTEELLREYELSYLDEDEDSITERSLLESVTECDGMRICKLPLTLDWSLGSFDFVELDSGSDIDPSSRSFIVVDVDADGKSDIMYHEGRFIRRGTGTGFTAQVESGVSIPGISVPQGDPRQIDVDGNIRTDLLVLSLVNDPELGFGHRWRLFDPVGSLYSPAAGEVDEWRPTEGNNDPVYLADMDGNGLPDFIAASFTGPWSYRLNTGASGANRFAERVVAEMVSVPAFGNFTVDTDGDGRNELIKPRFLEPGWDTWGMNSSLGEENGTANLWGHPIRTHFGDVNGDGLDDAIYPYGNPPSEPSSLRAQLNSGSGFGSRLTYGSPAGYVAPLLPVQAGIDHGVRLVDFDNDGRDDVLVFHEGEPLNANDQSRGLQLYVWRDGGFVRAPLSQEIGDWMGPGIGWNNAEVVDVDGDTVLDILHADAEGNLRFFKRQGGVPDRLIGIGDGIFAPRVEIDYTTLGDRDVHTPGLCTYPQACPTVGGHVVKQHRFATFSAAGDGWDRFDHTYRAARTDLLGRGWLGFAQHAVTRLATGATTVTVLDNQTRDAATKAYPLAHLPDTITHTVLDAPDGREHRRTVDNRHGVVARSGGGYHVQLEHFSVLEEERPAGASAWETVRAHGTDITYDDFGNIDLAISGTFGGRIVSLDLDHRNDTSSWIIGLRTRTLMTGCSADGECVTRETTFDYDDAGNHTHTIVEPGDPDLTLTTVTDYGEFGVVEAVTRTGSGESRTDRFAYDDADKLYPTSTFNALDHETTIETHSGLGVPLRTTDPNGVSTTMKYDGFGRLRETNHADGSFERIGHAFFGFQFTSVTPSDGPTTTLVRDALDREVERKVVTFAGDIATAYTRYDALGRVHQVSRPAVQNETVHYTTHAYDNRDRLISTTRPDGLIRHEYLNREVHTYDANNVHRYTVATVDGDIASAFEPDPGPGEWLETSYEYGPFGEIVKMVAADDTEQVMEYDVRGRRTRLEDPSRGVVVSDYDAFDGLISETDGANRTTDWLYDELGRVKRITSPDGEAIYKFDTANTGIGKPVNSTSTDDIGLGYRYNTEGNPSSLQWNIAGTGYQIAYDYDDDLGRLESITYPAIPGLAATDRLKVLYVYNEHGYLAQIKDAAANGPVYWTAETRNSSGQLTGERYANGVVTTYDYEPPTGLLEAITVTGPGDLGVMQLLSYDFDPERNVIERFDEAADRTDIYGYDDLNRLETWSATSPTVGLTATYAYDEVGNLRTETVVGVPGQNAVYGYGQDGAPPHALTSRNAIRYGYDAAGQQTSGPNRTVEYNRSGLPSVLTWGIGQGSQVRTEFAYDGNGARAAKTDAHQSVVYAGQLFERRIPAGTGGSEIHNLHNIVADGRVVAQVNRTQAITGGPITFTRVHYLSSDRQGSTTLLTRSDGQRHGGEDSFPNDLYYDPFGRRIDAAYQPLGTNRRGGPRQGFTGQTHEDEVSLIDMGGRFYDPAARRFLTPDPLIADRLNSQSLNRYAYVWNNPATLTDPSGFTPDDGGSDDDGAAVEVPGETIVITGTVEVEENGDMFWMSEGRYWAYFAGRRSITEYRTQWQWIAAKNISQKFRRAHPGTASFYRNMNALEKTMGVPTMAACMAVPACRIAMGDEAMEYLVDTAFGEGTYDEATADLPAGPTRPGPGGPGKKGAPGKGDGCIGPGCICFVPGTLVRMADGSTRPIEEIEPGDLVLADDPEDGSPPSAHEVVERHDTFTGRIVHIEVDDGDGIVDGEIESTGGHPFWTRARGWRDADSLLVGDELLATDGSTVVVAGLWVEPRDTPTHNLSVADLHTYFVVVGGVDVLVHNQAPFLTDDPYSPENVSRRQSDRRRDMGLNPDPNSRIPDQGPGRDMGGHEARGRTPHDTGERNVNPNEEHSRVAKGQGGRGPRGRRGCP